MYIISGKENQLTPSQIEADFLNQIDQFSTATTHPAVKALIAFQLEMASVIAYGNYRPDQKGTGKRLRDISGIGEFPVAFLHPETVLPSIDRTQTIKPFYVMDRHRRRRAFAPHENVMGKIGELEIPFTYVEPTLGAYGRVSAKEAFDAGMVIVLLETEPYRQYRRAGKAQVGLFADMSVLYPTLTATPATMYTYYSCNHVLSFTQTSSQSNMFGWSLYRQLTQTRNRIHLYQLLGSTARPFEENFSVQGDRIAKLQMGIADPETRNIFLADDYYNSIPFEDGAMLRCLFDTGMAESPMDYYQDIMLSRLPFEEYMTKLERLYQLETNPASYFKNNRQGLKLVENNGSQE